MAGYIVIIKGVSVAAVRKSITIYFVCFVRISAASLT